MTRTDTTTPVSVQEKSWCNRAGVDSCRAGNPLILAPYNWHVQLYRETLPIILQISDARLDQHDELLNKPTELLRPTASGY